jgi:hypothetical protein
MCPCSIPKFIKWFAPPHLNVSCIFQFDFTQDVSVEAAGGGARVASDEFDGFTFVDKSSALDTSKPESPSSALTSVTEAIDDDDV